MKKLLFWGPVLTASGYGEHARQLLKSILASGKFDVSVHSVKWGQTPFLNDDSEFVREITSLTKKYDDEKREGVSYDVSVQVTIPNEFQRLGKVSIGVTAGIEVDRVSPEWIKKANDNVDLVVVPSHHSAATFANVMYKDEKGNTLSLKKPVLVAPEGFDATVFNTDKLPGEDALNLDSDFNFLSVGLGLDKGFGEDRKNFSTLIKYFCETFKGDRRVGLVLKVSMVNNSLMDFETCKNRIQQIKQSIGCGEFPRIHVVHGRMTKEELARLYKHPKIKAYVTFTHGEGFGLPVIEAAACGLPVIATAWSGHLDFLHTPDGKKKFVPVEFDLKEVPDSAVWNGVIEKGTKWAYVKEDDAKSKLKKMFLSPDTPRQWASDLAKHLAETYSEDRLGKAFVGTIEKFIDDISGASTDVRNLPTTNMREKVYEQLGIPKGQSTLLYTMPMSAGDVFISTAVVNSLKKKFPEHLIIFATDQKYSSILDDNEDIYKVVQFEQWMMDVPLCEKIFDEVYTPNLAVQLNTSNWVHGGKGRLLGNELASQCHVEFGEYAIKKEDVGGLPEKFIAFHPGSGRGQWEARNYRHWKKVIHNIRKQLPGYDIVTLGLEGDIHFEGCVDLRGRTTYRQLAGVICKAACLIGIDSVSMHMAAAFGIPHVTLFGSSYSTSTGPVIKDVAFKNRSILLETRDRMGCDKACYKYQCSVDRESPCLNNINPENIVMYVVDLVTGDPNKAAAAFRNFENVRPKIAGYTHILDPEAGGYPYVESIKSMMGFCDEVIVVDGGSTDGSLEKIRELDRQGNKVKIFERKWDWNEPGMDGMQKAYGRAMCSLGPDDFLWQQDIDEVVHERDYEKIRNLTERFPTDVDVMHLPVVELWGDGKTVRTDRHSWKWRLSRNNFRVTHGINKDARVFDEKTGRTYAKKGMSDGCEYVDIMTGEYLPHKGFYTRELENTRVRNPELYGKMMNKVFSELPSVYHYSWADMVRKISNFKTFWNKCWSNLYNDPSPEDRFPDVNSREDMIKKANELRARGGEHGYAKTFILENDGPAVMNEWLARTYDADRFVHDNEEQTAATKADVIITTHDDAKGTVQADVGAGR